MVWPIPITGRLQAQPALKSWYLFSPSFAPASTTSAQANNTPNRKRRPFSPQFGKVGLRGRKKLTVFVRNLSAISTPFAVKVRKYSCTPCPPRLKISNMSYSALQRVVSNPRALRGYLDEDDDGGERVVCSGSGGKREERGCHGRTQPPPGNTCTEAAVRSSRARSLAHLRRKFWAVWQLAALGSTRVSRRRRGRTTDGEKRSRVEIFSVVIQHTELTNPRNPRRELIRRKTRSVSMPPRKN